MVEIEENNSLKKCQNYALAPDKYYVCDYTMFNTKLTKLPTQILNIFVTLGLKILRL